MNSANRDLVDALRKAIAKKCEYEQARESCAAAEEKRRVALVEYDAAQHAFIDIVSYDGALVEMDGELYEIGKLSGFRKLPVERIVVVEP